MALPKVSEFTNHVLSFGANNTPITDNVKFPNLENKAVDGNRDAKEHNVLHPAASPILFQYHSAHLLD